MAPHLIVFQTTRFRAFHRHILGPTRRITFSLPGHGDRVESAIVVSGNWVIYRQNDFRSPYSLILGPGLYADLSTLGISSYELGSAQPTDSGAAVSGTPIEGHIIFFDGYNLRGPHKHVLAATELTDFGTLVSSMVVIQGNWGIWQSAPTSTSPNRVIGPGIYPTMSAIGLRDNLVFKAAPNSGQASHSGTPVEGQVILFDDSSQPLQLHKHVVWTERELWVDFTGTTSYAILDGRWNLYAAPYLEQPCGPPLEPGLYPDPGNYDYGFRAMPRSMAPVAQKTTPDYTRPLPPSLFEAPHAILYQHANFRGAHKHVFGADPDLSADHFNDILSSVVVLAGEWLFYQHSNFQGVYPVVLGPGLHPNISTTGIANDAVSSVQPAMLLSVSRPGPTISGAAIPGNILLFEHATFEGRHQHILAPEPDLGQALFDNLTSSFVVLDGIWALYRGPNYTDEPQVGLRVGRATYPGIQWIGFPNDCLTSLRPVTGTPTAHGDDIPGHAIVFESPSFRGRHRHIFSPKYGLAELNYAAGSLVILQGRWRFSNAIGESSHRILGPGRYPDLMATGFRSYYITSLTPESFVYVNYPRDGSARIITDLPGGRCSTGIKWYSYLAPNVGVEISLDGTPQSPPLMPGNNPLEGSGQYGNLSIGPHLLSAHTRVWSDQERRYVSVSCSSVFFVNPQAVPTPPAPPINLSVTSPTADSLTLHWSDQSTNELGFKIERKSGSGTFSQVAIAGANRNEYVDRGLTSNTTYWYRVRAYNDGGDSNYSNTAEGKTQAAAPTGYSQVRIFNCDPNRHTVYIWLGDLQTGTWTRKGSLASQYNSSGSCPGSASPFTIALQEGHSYIVVAVDPLLIGCPGDDPSYGACRRLEQYVPGDAEGPALDVMIT